MKDFSRKQIISRRDYPKNIKGDKFSLYISNYPIIAEYLSKRIGNPNKILVELCCGIGVNLMILGDSFKRAIGVDIDRKILNYCFKNLELVKLTKKTKLICGDITDLKLLKKIQADIVIYDIPYWSAHKSEGRGDMTNNNSDLGTFIKYVKKHISKNIIVFAPPKYGYEYIKNELGACEYEKIFINSEHDRNIVYLGNLKKKNGVTEKYMKVTF